MASSESRDRLSALRDLLNEGQLSTQEELGDELKRLGHKVTQSTISRDLRKIGAVKAVDPDGRTTYRLPDDVPAPVATKGFRDLIREVETNGMIIVIHTTPGSASLVARHLDHSRPADILGTIAGDDTIFVAPKSIKDIRNTIKAIEQSFLSDSESPS